jgi:hypothetical protein
LYKSKLLLAAGLSLISFATGSLYAQETTRYTFDVGAGFTNSVGTTGQHLDTGWNLKAGAGVNLSPYFGVNLNLGYDSLGVNGATLTAIGAPGADLKIFSARIDPVVHVHPHSRADVYLTGGFGLYHRQQDFNGTSGLALDTDRFFGLQANQSFADYAVTKPGFDGGVGVAFGSKWHGKFFAEARYNRILMRDTHTDYLPVSFGFRW